MLAAGVTKVDILDVDVEHKETAILNSFPFDKFEVGVVTVEMHGKFADPAAIMDIMRSRGFKSFKLINNHVVERTDIVFINNKAS